MSNIRWTLAGVVIGSVFLALAMRGADLDAVFASLRTAQTLPIVAVLVAGAMFMAVKTVRWAIILRPISHVNFNALHSSVYIGTAANLVIAHSGELVRATLTGRRENIAPSAILASVGIERVFDLVTVATSLGVILLLGHSLHPSVAAAGYIAIALTVVALALMAVLAFPSRLRSGSMRLLERVLPPALMAFLTNQIKRSLVGLKVLGSPWLLLQVYLLSVLQWSFIVAAVWFCTLAVGQEIGVVIAITIWVLTVIGLTLPSSPAQLGTTQLAFALGLTFTQADPAAAFAASVVYTCAVNGPYMLLGLACWMLAGRRLWVRVPSTP